MKKLVSIISPCYNVAPYIKDFLDSLYNQTYKNLEIILVNDGSTDNTLDIIEAYSKKMLTANIQYRFFNQRNMGQAAAVNTALQYFTGDYLTWLDPDDKLPLDAIEKKVSYLETHKEIGTLVSKSMSIDEVTSKTFSSINRIPPKHNEKDELFFDLILGKNSTWNCGCYMVRASMFRDAMPKPLEIYAPRGIGQNMQMLLPIVYKYPIGYIDDITYIYRIRRDSHSHMTRTYEEDEKRISLSKTILYEIVSKMDIKKEDITKVYNTIENRIVHKQLYNMLRNNRKDKLSSVIKGLKQLKAYNSIEKKIVWSLKYPIVKSLITLKSKLHNANPNKNVSAFF